LIVNAHEQTEKSHELLVIKKIVPRTQSYDAIHTKRKI